MARADWGLLGVARADAALCALSSPPPPPLLLLPLPLLLLCPLLPGLLPALVAFRVPATRSCVGVRPLRLLVGTSYAGADSDDEPEAVDAAEPGRRRL